MAIDPVCAMDVDELQPRGGRCEYAGNVYFFCSEHCRHQFETDPESFLKPKSASQKSQASHYFCPMDPEIEAVEPGLCPKCGMALEAFEEAPETLEQDPEYLSMRRRFWLGLFFCVPLFCLDMYGLPQGPGPWIEALLASPVFFYVGWPFFERAWKALQIRELNMFSLISLGSIVAYLASCVDLFRPASPLYFEAAAVVPCLVALGQMLELGARRRSGEAIRSLLELRPKSVLWIGPEGDKELSLPEVQVGMRLRLRPGEKVAVDGSVESGQSFVNEAMLTGEATEVEKGPGDPLRAGTLNGQGSLVMRAEKVGAETALAHIIESVKTAARSRTPLQKLADRISAILIPLVLGLSAFSFFFWGLVFHLWAFGLNAAVSVLVYACPCALGLATPISLMVGLGEAAKLGLFFKDASELEALAGIDCLLLDKTGTLSEGKPRMIAMEAMPGWERVEILRLAAALEKASGHPLAKAFLAEASGALPESERFENKLGQGVVGQIGGSEIRLGRPDFCFWQGASLLRQAEAFGETGATVVYCSVDSRPAAFFVLRDELKGTAKEALEELRKLDIELRLLSGDQAGAVAHAAQALGIEHFEGSLRAEDKLRRLMDLRGAGRQVAMLGDGINDAPVLAGANVGIAVGGGSDVALQSAGVALLGTDLRALAKGIRLARRVRRNLRQNLAWAFVYNLLGLPFAAGFFYPAFHLLLPPMFSGAAMSMSSLSVIANALRLKGAAS